MPLRRGAALADQATLRRWDTEVFHPPVATAIDVDAQAFIDAAGLTDDTQIAAVNGLALDLKNAELWDKLQVIYPLVGGTADTHKWNLKDPRDANDAFRVTWSGAGIVHSATGVNPVSGDCFGNTHYVPLDEAIIDDASMSLYSRTDSVGGSQCDMGAFDPVDATRFHLIVRYDGDLFYPGLAETGSTPLVTPSTDSRGLFANSRLDVDYQHGYRNGAEFGPPSAVHASRLPSQAVYLLRLNDFPAGPSRREVAFYSIGRGFTDDEHADLNIAVQAYQTELGRQV